MQLKMSLRLAQKTDAGINQFRKEMLFLMGELKPKEFYEAIQATKDEKTARKKQSNKLFKIIQK